MSAQIKVLEQKNLEKDHQITSLSTRNLTLESDVEKLETSLAEVKDAASQSTSLKASNENYTKKLSVLEEELDEADKNLRETTAKLRETDIRAEQLERKVASLEAEKEESEKKYEALSAQYNAAKAELDEISQQLEAI